MSYKKKIKDKVKTIIDNNFTTPKSDISYVPDINNTKLTFGNTGLRFKATVLFIDLRGSTKLLNKHNKSTVAKIHMSYYHTIIQISKKLGGEIRSFNGDSLLVFFQGTTTNTLSNAVKAAMKMNYMLSHKDGIKSTLAKYTEIDFGIGIAHGQILCTKVGMGKDSNTKDIFWIGNAVNKSTKLSDISKLPNAISISEEVYNHLNDDVKYHIKKDYWGNNNKVDMWERKVFKYNDKSIYYFQTNYHWTIS